MVYEKYEDATALKAHSSTPYLKELFDVLKPLLDGAPEIEMYDELARLREWKLKKNEHRTSNIEF